MSDAGDGKKGERYVANAIDDMGHRFRELPANARGIDGMIEVYRHKRPTGQFIFVQIKSGSSFVRGNQKGHISIQVERHHAEYWRSVDGIPFVFVWHDPTRKRERAYWTPLSERTLSKGLTRVYIPSASVLGNHSAGALFRLARNFYGIDETLPRVTQPKNYKFKVSAIKDAAWQYYNSWRQENFHAPAYGRVRISLRAWKHITDASRPQQQVVHRLELLSAAREILLTVPTRHKCREIPNSQRALYMQTAMVKHNHRANAVVSVVVEQDETGAATFLSVFEHRSRRKDGEAVPQGLLGDTAE